MEKWIESNDAGWLRVIGMVKEDDLHSCSIGGKDTEVCSFRSYGRAERIGMADTYLLSGRIARLSELLMWLHLPLHANGALSWTIL